MSSYDPEAAPSPAADEEDEEATRRWVIKAASKSRPGLTLEELTSVLAESGFTVSARELGADLNAIGHRLVTTDDGSTIVVPGAEESADTAGNDPAYASADNEADGAADRKRLFMVIGAALAALLLVVVVVVAVSGNDDDSPEAGGDGATASNTSGPPPTEPRTTPGLDFPPVTRISFQNDERNNLGGFSDQGMWRLLGGTWEVSDGVALMTEPAADRAATLAIAPETVSTANLIVNLHVPSTSGRTGVAFRVKDDKNFWMLLLSTRYGTLVLLRVVDGKAQQIDDAGVVDIPPLDVSMGVRAEGNMIIGYLQGNPVLDATDPDLAPGTGFGLAALKGAEQAEFDDLLFKAI